MWPWPCDRDYVTVTMAEREWVLNLFFFLFWQTPTSNNPSVVQCTIQTYESLVLWWSFLRCMKLALHLLTHPRNDASFRSSKLYVCNVFHDFSIDQRSLTSQPCGVLTCFKGKMMWTFKRTAWCNTPKWYIWSSFAILTEINSPDYYLQTIIPLWGVYCMINCVFH